MSLAKCSPMLRFGSINLLCLVHWLWLGASPGCQAAEATRHALVLDAFAQSADSSCLKTVVPSLQQRAGYQVRVVPCNADAEQQCQQWLNQVKARSEQLLVLMRGSLRPAGQETWLGPDSTKPDDPNRGSINLSQFLAKLRSVPSQCHIAFLIDCGGGTSADIVARWKRTEATMACKAASLSVFVAGLTNSPNTVASNDENSSIHWFQRGWQGEADGDGDRQVLWSEFEDFIVRHSPGNQQSVSWTSQANSLFCRCRPQKLDEVLADLAEQISRRLHDQQISVLGVPDWKIQFSTTNGTDTPGADTPGVDAGPLMRYCVAKLSDELRRRAKYKYSLNDGDGLRRLLNEQGVNPDNLGSEAMERLTQGLKHNGRGPSNPAILVADLTYGGGQELAISGTVWKTASGEQVWSNGAAATLNPAEWAMLGNSAVNVPALSAFQTPEAPPAAESSSSVEVPEVSTPSPSDLAATSKPSRKPTVKTRLVDFRKPLESLDFFDTRDVERAALEIARLETNSQRENPMCQPNFPFSLYITVDGKDLERRLSADGRHVYVKTSVGQHYHICLENNSKRNVFVRLLVDGLNTLPDRAMLQERAKGKVGAGDQNSRLLPAQYVNLTTARPWHCPPGSYDFPGFYTEIEEDGVGDERQATRRDFVITDATNSEAHRRGFTKDVGIITAAFFEPTARPKHLAPVTQRGSTLGDREETENVKVLDGELVPGALLCVLHLRYGIEENP